MAYMLKLELLITKVKIIFQKKNNACLKKKKRSFRCKKEDKFFQSCVMNNKTLLLGLSLAVLLAIFIYITIRNRTKTCKFHKLVLIRHGEKPENGLGNLDCKGLNRSLALPDVLIKKFGTPDFIFAPNPARKIRDKGIYFNYIRPLVTIEPTAVKCNVPINSNYGFTQIHELLDELTNEKYSGKTIFIAWEHVNLDKFARLFAKNVMNVDDSKSFIPKWSGSDFDSIFVFTQTIDKSDFNHSKTKYEFSIDKENLNNLSNICPS